MREKRFGKRCLTWVLIMMMTLSLLPVSALAADGEARFYGKNVTIMDDCDTDLTAVQDAEDNDAVVYEGESEVQPETPNVEPGHARIGDAEYDSLEAAVKASKSGDTIQLGEGEYSLYTVCGSNGASNNETYTKGKDLTFVGAGTDKTTWMIGAPIPDPDKLGTEYNSDYSFEGSESVTFKNMTLRTGKDGVSVDYLGFSHSNITIVENCVMEGRTAYWGYKSATFRDTTFNCPTETVFIFKIGAYAVQDYSSATMTFDNCTFNNARGKVVHVYREGSYTEGETPSVLNFNNCTVNSSTADKSVLNVKDNNHSYIINISGKNTVNGLKANDYTCSKLFQVEGWANEYNLMPDSKGNGKGCHATVTIDGEPVWTEGKMVNHAYTDGQKDDNFRYENSWELGEDGLLTVKSKKICNYCGYYETSDETRAPKITTSKNATQLDTSSWTSDVTLSMTGEQVGDSFYSIPANFSVTDTIGSKFDLIPDSFKLTVGGTALKSKTDGDKTYFGNTIDNLDEQNCRFVITYDEVNDSFVWTANEPVVDEANLTYTVTLAKPQRGTGTYGVTDLNGDRIVDGTTDTTYTDAEALYTNESAVLTVKYDENDYDFTFPKPSVSYTVSRPHHPSKPDNTVEIPDEDALGLNTDDHFAYIIGYPDGTVQPNGQITRAEATTIFFRLLTDESRDANLTKTNRYADVAADAWYNTAVSTMTKAGIVDGYPDGTFRPDAPITRAEMAKIISLFAKLDKSESRFTDIAGHWAEAYIKLAAGNGWIAGYPDGTFAPQRNITRAETATMINRVLDRVPSEESHLLSRGVMQIWPDSNPGDWFYLAMQEATNSHDYERNAKWAAADEQWTALRENRNWTALEQ